MRMTDKHFDITYSKEEGLIMINERGTDDYTYIFVKHVTHVKRIGDEVRIYHGQTFTSLYATKDEDRDPKRTGLLFCILSFTARINNPELILD